MSQPIFNITTPGFTPDGSTAGGGPVFSRPYTTDLTPQDIISISTRSGEPKKNGFAHNLKEYGKGLFNGGWNTITSLFTLKGLAFALGTAALVTMTGGAALPFLAVAGLGLGTIQTMKGALSGNWEQAGEGTFTLGASMLGMKGISKTPEWTKPWMNIGKEQAAKVSGTMDSAVSGAKNLGNKFSSGFQSMITGAQEQVGKLKSTVFGSNSAAEVEGAAGTTVKNGAPDLPVTTEKPLVQVQSNGEPKTAPPQESKTTSETTQTNEVNGGDPKTAPPKADETPPETPQVAPNAEGTNPPPPEATVETTQTNGADGGEQPSSSNKDWQKCKDQTAKFFGNRAVSGHIYSGTIPNSFSSISNKGTDN